MLTHRIRFDGHEDAIEFQLEGKHVYAHRMVWLDTSEEWVAAAKEFAKACWCFDTHTVADSSWPADLLDVVNRVFGSKLRALDPPRQQGLFPTGCSVCGDDQNTFPESAVYDGYGNLQGQASPEPVTWSCHVCDRLVCRSCTLARDDGEYYFHTYCSPACRAAAPRSFMKDDESMR